MLVFPYYIIDEYATKIILYKINGPQFYQLKAFVVVTDEIVTATRIYITWREYKMCISECGWISLLVWLK